MPRIRLVIALALLAIVPCAGRPSDAAEPYVEFVHRLQERSYIDMALYYLDSLEARPELPALVREVLDLERCQTYVAWAAQATDPKVAEQRFGQAQAFLDKFRKEHPADHRGAASLLRWGDACLDRGQQAVTRAERLEDQTAQHAALLAARGVLEEACERLGQAESSYARWLEQLPPGTPESATAAKPSPLRPRREEVELGAVEARFKAALARYHLAHTYADHDANRERYLKDASARFDQLYQELRNTASETCLHAHLWQARALADLGDLQDARDIFDEVLANEPEEDSDDCPQAPLYAQARFFQFQGQLRRLVRDKHVQEASEWLQAHRSWRTIPAYQGLVVEVARAQLTLARKAKDDERNERLRQAAELLAGACRVASPYRDEAALLQRQLLPELGQQALDAQQHLTLGDGALAARKLAAAEQDFARALQLATERGDSQLAAAARERLNRTRYLQARELYAAGKYEDALTGAGQIAREDAAGPHVAQAAILALSAAHALCTVERDKDAALTRMEKIAEYVIKKWSGRSEADQALITLARVRLQRGEADAAMAFLSRVRSDSPHRATVLYTTGQMHWRTYLRESAKDQAARDAQQLASSLAAAREALQKAVALCREAGSGADLDVQLADVQLLLADVLLEGRAYRDVVTLLDALVARGKSPAMATLDPSAFRALAATARARLALGDNVAAGETMLVLIQKAADEKRCNELLVNLARLVRQEWNRQAASTAGASGKPPPAAEAAAVQRETLRQLLLKTLPALAARREHSAANRTHLGDLCAELGLNDEATRQFGLGLQAGGGPLAAKDGSRVPVRARVQLVNLLRSQGKFAEAAKLNDELIGEYPRHIELRLTKARLLEDWAAQEPQKYAPAVAEWTEVRKLLGRLPQKPPDYYDAVYHTASCLYGQWVATKDASRLLQAEQVLKATLVTSSKLAGPEMVAKYQALLKEIAAAQPRRGS